MTIGSEMTLPSVDPLEREMDLQEAFDKGFEAVKAYVDSEIGALADRLAVLERRVKIDLAGAERTR